MCNKWRFVYFLSILLVGGMLIGCGHKEGIKVAEMTKSEKGPVVETSKVKESTKIEHKSKDFLGKISELFPDTAMANHVAEMLNKKIDASVTREELASITGIFQVPVNDTNNLKGIGYLTGLTGINCCKNNVKEIPAEIGNLSNLEILDFCKSYSLEYIPPEIGKLKKLKIIRLSMTSVSFIPKEIGELTNLEVLLCNSFGSIPKEIGKLKNLRILMYENLESIPKEIGDLENLEELNIHGGSVGDAINSIAKLTNLKKLDLGDCKLREFPKSILKLKNLKRLNLFGNDIREIPAEIGNLIELEELNTYDNYNLQEDYKKYLPKRYDYEKEIVQGTDCIIELPKEYKKNSDNIKYQFKKSDESDITEYCTKYTNYITVTPEKDGDNKLILRSSLFPKVGRYNFRILVESKASYPRYSIYKWLIDII